MWRCWYCGCMCVMLNCEHCGSQRKEVAIIEIEEDIQWDDDGYERSPYLLKSGAAPSISYLEPSDSPDWFETLDGTTTVETAHNFKMSEREEPFVQEEGVNIWKRLTGKK